MAQAASALRVGAARLGRFVLSGNLALLLDEAASTFPYRPALVAPDWTLSYRDLDDASSRLASILVDKGVRPGDRVALTCPNTPWFTISYFAILKVGGVVVPLNVMLKAVDVAFHLDLMGAAVYLCGEGGQSRDVEVQAFSGFQRSSCENFLVLSTAAAPMSPELGRCQTLGSAGWERTDPHRETVRTSEDDIAALLFTSGTSGVPKAAELRHRNLRSNAEAGEVLFGADALNPDTFLAALPLSHSFGQTVVQNGAIASGGTVVLMEQFDAHLALELMERHAVTFLAGVPTMYWSLCDAARGSRSLARKAATLRIAVSGGATLASQVHDDVQRHFGLTLLEGYGLSETSPIAAFSRLGYSSRVGSIGTPIPGVQMELLQIGSWEPVRSADTDAVGEIAVRGPNVMRGYYRDPDATNAILRDGWLKTGDLGRRDVDGWYYVVDRASDVIIRGGYNIYPSEVEATMRLHPAVESVAVVGTTDERLGEEIAAFVILRPGEHIDANDLIAWTRERLPAYKYPRRITFLDRLPFSATGKLLKRALVQQVPVPRRAPVSATALTGHVRVRSVTPLEQPADAHATEA
jgi:long-chain acyl-CoA synthetase